jgi:hypothetical protein
MRPDMLLPVMRFEDAATIVKVPDASLYMWMRCGRHGRLDQTGVSR